MGGVQNFLRLLLLAGAEALPGDMRLRTGTVIPFFFVKAYHAQLVLGLEHFQARYLASDGSIKQQIRTIILILQGSGETEDLAITIRL